VSRGFNVPAGSYGSSITIDELTGSRRYSVTLIGAGLPHQGAAWGAENRIPTEFYPGNFTEGTQQVIGPKESPSHWTGKWTRTLLLRSPVTLNGDSSSQSSQPSNVADFLEQMFLGGARLRVTWTQTKLEYNAPSGSGRQSPSGPTLYQIVREGRASKWEFTPLTGDDIKWDVSWKWVGRGGTQNKVVATRDSVPTSLTAAVISTIQNARNYTGPLSYSNASNPLLAFSASIFTLGLSENFSPDFVDLSDGLNSDLFTIQTNLSQTGDVSLTLDDTPDQISNSILNLSVDAVETVNTFSDNIGQMPFEVLSNSVQATDVAYAAGVAGGQVTQAWLVREAAQNAATRARILASMNPGGGVKGVQQTSSTGPGQLLGVYRTCQGDTAQRVARQWYGNADRAGDLLKANHLPLGQPSFVVGTVLLIPVLKSSAKT